MLQYPSDLRNAVFEFSSILVHDFDLVWTTLPLSPPPGNLRISFTLALSSTHSLLSVLLLAHVWILQIFISNGHKTQIVCQLLPKKEGASLILKWTRLRAKPWNMDDTWNMSVALNRFAYGCYTSLSDRITRLFNGVVNSAACKRSAYPIRAKSILQIQGKIKRLEGKQFQFYYSLKKLHNNFLCSHIAQLVEAGRGHLNIK